ncbi:putative C8orf37 protein [Plasmopara halstedii]
MNFQDLLDEIEDAMDSPRRSRESIRAGNSCFSGQTDSSKIIQAVNKGRIQNELDDLLNLLNDEERKLGDFNSELAKTKLHCSFKQIDSQAGALKKCLKILMDGGRANRGLNTAFSSRVCSNLRCNECDFAVLQFFGKSVTNEQIYVANRTRYELCCWNRKWDATADYMFFRENMPNEAKLRVKLEIAPGSFRKMTELITIC